MFKCARAHPHIKLVSCPFNSTHRFKKEDEKEHLSNCEFRGTFDSYLLGNNVEKIAVPEIPVEEQSENWDNMNYASYNPENHVNRLPIRRKLIAATKSDKKKFREAERIRHAQLRHSEFDLDDNSSSTVIIVSDNEDTGTGTATGAYDSDDEVEVEVKYEVKVADKKGIRTDKAKDIGKDDDDSGLCRVFNKLTTN